MVLWEINIGGLNEPRSLMLAKVLTCASMERWTSLRSLHCASDAMLDIDIKFDGVLSLSIAHGEFMCKISGRYVH